MGDIAEMMLDGTLCEGCGVYLEDESDGIPRRCADCVKEDRQYASVSQKIACPLCNKKVKATGLSDHTRDVHGVNVKS